jgi:hypothetical protein
VRRGEELAVMGVGPNYHTPAGEIYRRVARGVLTHDRNLDLLLIPRPRKPRVDGLPSWVPDWSITDQETESLSYIANVGYRASKESVSLPKFDGDVLELEGMFFGKIAKVSNDRLTWYYRRFLQASYGIRNETVSSHFARLPDQNGSYSTIILY